MRNGDVESICFGVCDQCKNSGSRKGCDGTGFDGILIFKAKTSELLDYYMNNFGARQVASYDPFRLVIWEDAAATILSDFITEVRDNGSERA